MDDLRKLRRLSLAEVRDLSLALVLLPAIAVALRLAGLRRVRKAIEVKVVPPSARGRPPVAQVARLVALAARRGPVKATCMVQALTLQYVLARRGFHSQLRLGVRKIGNRLEAHAWVEHDGRPLIDSADVAERYAPFETPSPEPRQ